MPAYELAASFVQRTSKTLSLSTTHVSRGRREGWAKRRGGADILSLRVVGVQYFNGLLGMETHDHESDLKEEVYSWSTAWPRWTWVSSCACCPNSKAFSWYVEGLSLG